MSAPRGPTPPRLWEALLRARLPEGVRSESILGDLHEELVERAEASSAREASRWYRCEALSILSRSFGGRTTVRRSPRVRREAAISTLLRELRLAFRSLARSPGLVVVAVVTVALGVGANTAMFSIVHAVLLEPLPFPDPDTLVRPWAEKRFSTGMFRELRERTEATFSEIALYEDESFGVAGGDLPLIVPGAVVTPGFLGVVGIRPTIGRDFEPDDGLPGAEPVAILGYEHWRDHFGSDRLVLGRVVPIDGLGATSRTVVGVMPPSVFSGWLPEAQIWAPLRTDEDAPNAGSYGYSALARLAPGVTLERARAQMAGLEASFEPEHGTQFRPSRASPVPILTLHETLVGDSRRPLSLLLGAVGLVLLIACANVAHLLLVRGTNRGRELALRQALGASRRRILAHLLAESAVLGLFGGATGALLAVFAVGRARSVLPGVVPAGVDLSLSPEVLGFCLALSLLAALVFGSLPALAGMRRDPVLALREEGRSGTSGRRRSRWNQLLVVAEVSLAVVLITSAGLLLESVRRIHSVDPGFDSDRLVALLPAPPSGRYAEEGLTAYVDELLARLGGLPFVEEVTTVNRLPLTLGNVGVPYFVEGQDPADAPGQVMNLRVVDPGFFRTLGIPLSAGRLLDESDRGEGELVGVVNRAAVDLHWKGGDPVGRPVFFPGVEESFRVVGVVPDIRQHRLDLPSVPQVYLARAQVPANSSPFFLVRTAIEPAEALDDLRTAVHVVDPDVPIQMIEPMEQVLEASVGDRRALSGLFGAFAFLSLAMGVVGVFGVASFVNGGRLTELAVRTALGATRLRLLGDALGTGLQPVAWGLVAGMAASLGLTRFLEGLLYGVAPHDPATYALVAGILGLTAVAAAFLPAWRASRVDPAAALAR